MIDIDSNILRTIDCSFEDFFTSSNNPGLVYGISYKGTVIHSGSFGSRTLLPLQAMEQDSISRIASMTKSFACAAVLQLRDRGLLDINAPLSSLVARLPLAEQFKTASLRDLMAMRLDLPVDDPWADRLLGASDSTLENYFNTPLLRAGVGSSTCSYSNISYMLLGRVIREVCGQPAMEYISEQILLPLGLHDTVWNVSKAHQARQAAGYRVDTMPQQEEQHFECQSDGVVFGGLWSTIKDLAVWLEFLRAGDSGIPSWETVLSKESRRELWQPYSWYPTRTERSLITAQPITSKAHYGFGLVIHTILGADYIAHSGGLPGYGSHMRFDPVSGLGVIALGNGTYCRAAAPCASALHHLALSCESPLLTRFDTVIQMGYKVAEFILQGAVEVRPDLFSYNVWQDTRPDSFARETRDTIAERQGEIRVESVACISGYEGEIVFTGSATRKKLSYTLAPIAPPRVQSIAWVADQAR